MKKEIKVVAIILVALIVFLAGFGLGATKGININIGSESGINVNVNGSAGGSAPVVATTAAPVTQAPTTAAPVTQAPTTAAPSGDTTTTAAPSGDTTTTAAPSGDTTTAAPTDAPSTSSVPSTPAEIAEAYNKALNAYRSFTGTVTTTKVETIDIGVTDLPALAASVVNSVVESFTGTTENTWTFTNGVDPDGRVPADKIIPWGRDAAVKPEGLASASATANADGGYTMTMVFVAEDSVFDGTKNTSEPTYHMGAMDPLNLGSLDLGPITIAKAELHYPGATLEATVDGEGRLVKLHNNLPLSGFGTGKAVVELTINLEGSMDSTWTMVYA